MYKSRTLKGFTLIELIVVMGILAILATIVVIAVNPARQFASARNAKRNNDVLAVLDAVHQYAADNNGTLPASIPSLASCAANVNNTSTASGPMDIGTVATVGANLNAVLVTNYLTAIPTDPTNGTSATTRYQICKDSTTSIVTVGAIGAELSQTIKVSR